MKQTFARFIITLYVYKTQQIKHPSRSLVFSLLMGVGEHIYWSYGMKYACIPKIQFSLRKKNYMKKINGKTFLEIIYFMLNLKFVFSKIGIKNYFINIFKY